MSLTGRAGLLKQFTKNVLETALSEELTEHLGHEKNRAAEGRAAFNVRNGTRPKTVLTHATGKVDLEVPRDRDGTFKPVIVKEAAAASMRPDRISPMPALWLTGWWPKAASVCTTGSVPGNAPRPFRFVVYQRPSS